MRVARLTYGRLPLLDALQRRWGASLASTWPEASDLPFAFAGTGGRGMEIGGQHDSVPGLPGTTRGPGLPIVEAHPAAVQRATAGQMRGGPGGEPALEAERATPALAASQQAEGPGASPRRESLPIVKVRRSSVQDRATLTATQVSSGPVQGGPAVRRDLPSRQPRQRPQGRGSPLGHLLRLRQRQILPEIRPQTGRHPRLPVQRSALPAPCPIPLSRWCRPGSERQRSWNTLCRSCRRSRWRLECHLLCLLYNARLRRARVKQRAEAP